ncbi:hypothetical protein EDI_152320 [Entamoeba dispar SAW760]|uniref:F-box domain-containing protein n=1 Tax=Entamoeba dispar (strain ATCC PRA-260 / SAW760) TaxID=370354 RepID=B0EU69_ENTDS|nr:uncharacterized protein EDI_152320 [Entamoeba dispar SAW760]EDR21930.1 hypothetical protein EDI_152320 [Entamoeba dispar SAW760]|eukprot:EDR21930.1 hypothetical protein EDI_152320 [Entamoeba dispar SAW760]
MKLDKHSLYDVVEYLPQRYYNRFICVNKKCFNIVEHHPNEVLLHYKSITSSSTIIQVEEQNYLELPISQFDNYINQFELCLKLKILKDQNETLSFEELITPNVFRHLLEIIISLNVVTPKLCINLDDIGFGELKIVITQSEEFAIDQLESVNIIKNNLVILKLFDWKLCHFIQKERTNIHVVIEPNNLIELYTNKINKEYTSFNLISCYQEYHEQIDNKQIVLNQSLFNDYEYNSNDNINLLLSLYLPSLQSFNLPSFSIVSLRTHNPFIECSNLIELTIDIKHSHLTQLHFNFSQFTSLSKLCLFAHLENRSIKIPAQIRYLVLNQFVRHLSNIIILHNGQYIGKGLSYLNQLNCLEVVGISDDKVDFPQSLHSLKIQSVDIDVISTKNLTQLTKLYIHGPKISELDLPIPLCELTLIQCRKLQTLNVYGKMRLIDKIEACPKVSFKKKID